MDAFEKLKKEIDEQVVELVAVSKTKPTEKISDLYVRGQRAFGENRVQELVEKQALLPNDIEWHFIGHLQRNKVKYIAPFVHLIHSIDSLKLLREVDKQGKKLGRKIEILLQIHIATEESKFGLDKQELIEILEYYTADPSPFQFISIRGLMGMATFTEDTEQVRKEFKNLKDLFEFSKSSYLLNDSFKEISMGMSGDYAIAIEEGSTMIRIGSMLFGSRS